MIVLKALQALAVAFVAGTVVLVTALAALVLWALPYAVLVAIVILLLEATSAK